MILPEVIKKIRLSTCAVHRMAVKHEEAFAGVEHGDKVMRPDSEVVATAFLVGDGMLLTNRHVVKLLEEDHTATGSHDHWYVEFVYPREDRAGWSQTLKRIGNIFALLDPSGSGSLDVGLLAFRQDPGDLGPCKPVEFGKLEDIVVGTTIAICGFPFGNKSLTNDFGFFRFGPVVHSGIISAVSPYDTVDERAMTTFLTDLNSADGMSGSPVFLPTTGEVIGLHYAGVVATMGSAIPVDSQRLQGWIRAFERAIADGQQIGQLTLTASGDLIES